MTRTAKDIRNEFLEFFKERGHTYVPSSSLLPADDPTLLFANAGMNQFKDIFLGLAKRDYVRAVNSQKCIRAGGKHNDLEDVGHDTYHHTFFEMLGNWSFGDYFKKEAIAWAWELLTKVWGLPKERLHATVFGGDEKEGLVPDDEAADLWLHVTDIDPSHIHKGGKKDNFWEMGETGPCGPCSEIHYDFTPDLSGGPLVNAGDPRVIEIWNLVFMQFNRDSSGKLTTLPAKHVDTGMGLERIARVLQGVGSNYDIDIFKGIFDAIHKAGAFKPYTGRLDDIKDTAYRVVADHARALTFAIADGVIPSNEGRGYVLRRILRRAARYGRQHLKIKGQFISRLVPTVVDLMGDVFPEIRDRQKYVGETIASEEESFGKTLDRGIDLFNKEARKLRQAGRKVFGGREAFTLYATYGFPVDLTQVMAGEQGMTVDLEGYEQEMALHRQTSSVTEAFKADAITNLPATDDSAKYSRLSLEATVLGWVTSEEEEPPEVVALRKMASDPKNAPPKVQIGRLSEGLSAITVRLGVTVPPGTAEWVYRERVVHAMRSHPDVTEDDVASLPMIVGQPDYLGAAANAEGLKRLWFAKQVDMDHLFIAVYGEQEGRLVMRGYYKGLPGSIIADLKSKGVPLEAVANSAVLSFDHPGSQPGLVGSKATPRSIIGARSKEVKRTAPRFVTQGELWPGAEACVVLDRTNFYGEQGGQVGDAGSLTFEGGTFIVRDTVRAGQCILHVGVMEQGTLRPGQKVIAAIDPSRFDTMRNHTATHLLNWALRKVLGEHVNQAGSVVAPDRLRFDFTHNQALTEQQVKEVEALVNERVLADEPVTIKVMPLAEAQRIPGVRAVFGEKYPDPVRVVSIGSGMGVSPVRPADISSAESSMGTRQQPTAQGQDAPATHGRDAHATRDTLAAEFCGGTHLEHTSQVGLFKILAEESVAKGVRRITAVSGHEAVKYVQQLDEVVRSATAVLRTNPAELADRIAAMQKEIKDLRKAPRGAAGGDEFTAVHTLDTPAGQVLVGQSSLADAGEIRNLCDRLRQKGAAAVFVASAGDGKVTLIAMVDQKVADGGKLKAGDWVKAVAPVVGGSGGGKPTMAQAGGKAPDKLPDALKAAADFALVKLK
ncbi:MAG: alanine--tRNA ligase [Phycisphaerae bacterium]